MKQLTSCGFALLFAAILLVQPARAQQQAKEPTHSIALIYLDKPQPHLIRLHVEVDDTPALRSWGRYMMKWFRFLDRDGNRKLDSEELAHAPSPKVMQQLMQRGFYYVRPGQTTPTPKGKEMGLQDFARYYLQTAGPLQLSAAGYYQNNDQASTALMKYLDRDGDGGITKSEADEAEDSLIMLDRDDDELIEATELSGGRYPYVYRTGRTRTTPTTAMGKDFYIVVDEQSQARAVLVLLSKYDANGDKKLSIRELGLDRKNFNKFDDDKDDNLAVEEIGNWLKLGSQLELTARVGTTSDDPVSVQLHGKSVRIAKKDEKLVASLGSAEITVEARADVNATMRMVQQRTSYYMRQFQQGDRQKRGYLTRTEATRLTMLRTIFDRVDRNDDDKMTKDELSEWLVLLGEGRRCYASIAIAARGRALFQSLDGNRDNRLTIRELRSVWGQLKDRDANKNGVIEPSEIARQFDVSLSKGVTNLYARRPNTMYRPRNLANTKRPPSRGPRPTWFTKMDRNGDGDVSAREFLGSRESFGRIDFDKDGLIDAEEAKSADAAMRNGK